MEKMPFHPRPEAAWRLGLPELTGSFVAMREVRPDEAPQFWATLWPQEAAHVFVPLPRSTDELRPLLRNLVEARQAGSAIGFTAHATAVVGLVCVRALEPSFETAEWAFAFAPDAWMTQAPAEALVLVRNFLFETIGTRRIESRTVVSADRQIACLQRLGALQESVLRRSLPVGAGYADQILWAIVKDDVLH